VIRPIKSTFVPNYLNCWQRLFVLLLLNRRRLIKKNQ